MSTSSVAVPGAKQKRRPPAEQPVVHYADSDGQPMAENDPQRICIVDTHFLGLGVQEYFLFDPTGEYFDPILQGYRLVEENYQPLAPLLDSTAPLLGLWSEVLSLELRLKENGGEGMPYVLRLYDPETWLPTPDEERAARQAAEARAAEAELARVQAELARLRGESQEEGEDES